MSDEKKLEKVLIINPKVLTANIAYAEMIEDWLLPKHVLAEGEENTTRAALVLYIPYPTIEDIQQLKDLLVLTEAEAREKMEEQRRAMEMMEEAGLDMDSLGMGYGEDIEPPHDCDSCPAYDACDLPIKKPRSGEDEGGDLLS